MKNSLRVLLSTRSVSRSRRGATLLVAAALSLTLTGCPTGYVHTSTGATVAAPVVAAQDAVGDALQILQDVHNAAVDRHDALAGQEPADVHARRRTILLGSAAALRASWDALAAWKQAPASASSVTVLAPFAAQAGPLLDAAVELGIVPAKWAAAAKAWLGAPAATLGKPGGVQTGQIHEPRETGYGTLITPYAYDDLIPRWSRQATVNSDLLHRGSYFDGCNWHTTLPNGGELVTAMGCGHSTLRLSTSPLTSTLENRVMLVDGKLVAITDGRPE